MAEQGSRFKRGGDEMGMSDAQFKTYLLEQLENWQNILKMAKKHQVLEIQEEAEKQIDKINKALQF